ELSLNDIDKDLNGKEYTTIADSCVGAGAMLIAAADVIREKGVDVSTGALFFGQDLDQTAANMAYIQLSLIGCAALIVEGNTLTEPYTGNPLFVDENSRFWYTPALFMSEWNKRRIEELKALKRENIA
ncbi:MAG: SAM-dependent DNA methyltransferase, partial [Butyrivibrio sp.]|nr:SAM-dependent DNA methyltransferase [Butyrivibrio sp.]